MADNQNYSCTNELGAEILVAIMSMCIIITVLFSLELDMFKAAGAIMNVKFKNEDTNLVLSLAYTLVLPLMSYMFSQAKKYNPEGRAQLILTWMVFIEVIRINGDPISAWKLRKSAEQLIRLFWVSYLIYSFTFLNGIKLSLLILCVYFAFSVVWNGIIFNLAKNSYLIGNNPNLIYNYLVKDDLLTTPLNNCSYIVFGEENHEISVEGNGYTLGEKKSDSSEGVITIGRVFQLNLPEDEAFNSKHPRWRNKCLSFALAKILRCRFVKLSLDEADCKKARAFVLEGLIDYIGRNGDIQTDECPIERVFSIIRDELTFISDFLEMRIPVQYFYPPYLLNDAIAYIVVVVSGIYIICLVFKRISVWLSFVAQDATSCFSQIVHGYVLIKHLSRLDQAITISLFIASIYVINIRVGRVSRVGDWSSLEAVQQYIKPVKCWKPYSSKNAEKLLSPLLKLVSKTNDKKSRVHHTVFDIREKNIFLCLKINWSFIMHLPHWVRRTIPRAAPTVHHSSNAKEVILTSLKESLGRLTNGETSINIHDMKHLNLACKLHESTTEVILVWHIATTLFYLSDPNKITNSTNQEHSPPGLKEQEATLDLSNYCYYLVAYFPELLPNVVEGTTTMYERVIKEILDIGMLSDQESTRDYRCNHVLQNIRDENSVIGKGANLAKELIKREDRMQVWKMLAKFWAEMMLFIAPSDNVEGHKKILDRGELITQLWALLTHAGIISRPKRTKYHHREGGENSNGVNGDDENSEITMERVVRAVMHGVNGDDENSEITGDLNV